MHGIFQVRGHALLRVDDHVMLQRVDSHVILQPLSARGTRAVGYLHTRTEYRPT